MQNSVLRGETRDLILDATEQLLARYGYRKMTMDDLAKEAGVAKRTIYHHFPGKEEVALCSIDRVVARLLEQLERVARRDEPPDRRLREMLRTRVLFRFDSVQNYYQSFNEMFAALRPAYLARRERYFQAEANIFAEILREGCAAGVFACRAPTRTAHTLLVATNALLPFSLSPRELGARADIEASVLQIADLLLDGLRRRTE
jgi:AcrR family transcriptional regulator